MADQPPTREHLLHRLYEAAELEHNLMCTYLYAAFSLKGGVEDGLTAREAEAVARWRSAITQVAIEEMGHLTAVWNITSALGGTPHFERSNFPLDPGELPANVVVKLAPFSAAVLQHFIYLERPDESQEADGEGFAPDFVFTRGVAQPRLTPMPIDYATVGAFYARLSSDLRAFVAHVGEQAAFCGNPGLQLSQAEVTIFGAKPVICIKTALAAFDYIVTEGEGAPLHNSRSHYVRFIAVREELAALKAANPDFRPAFPAAENPVLRRPVRAGKRVWIENEEAAEAVDLANAAYALMLRLIAYSYVTDRAHPHKRLAVDLGIGVMRAVAELANFAARLPAGPSNPDCHAGMSFTALRDAAPLPAGDAAVRFFRERFAELSSAASRFARDRDGRVLAAARQIAALTARADNEFG